LEIPNPEIDILVSALSDLAANRTGALVVIQGRLEVRLGADTPSFAHVLDEGDAMVSPGDAQHHFRNLSVVPCIYYIVIDNTRWR